MSTILFNVFTKLIFENLILETAGFEPTVRRHNLVVLVQFYPIKLRSQILKNKFVFSIK